MGEGERLAYVTLLIKSSNALNHLSLTDAAILAFAKILKKHPVPLTPYFLRRGINVAVDDMTFILQELMNMGLVKEVIQRNHLSYGMTQKLFHINNLSDSKSESSLVAPTEADLEIEMTKRALFKRAVKKSVETEQIEEYLKNRPLKRKKTAKEIHDSGECDKSTCRLCLLEKEGEIENERTNASGNSDYKNKSEHISATDSGILAKDDSRTSRFQSRQNSSDNSSCESNLRRYNREESLENLSSQEGFQYIPASLLSEENKTASADLYMQCPICGADFKGKSLEEMEEHGRNCI